MTTTLLLGTGRMAYHLGHALQRAGLTLVGVAGRNAAHTEALARKLGIAPFALGAPLPRVDTILIAVSDDAIADVAMNIPMGDAVVIHTSGAAELDRLLPHAHRAVLWPLISLSPGEPMDLGGVPVVIDSNTEKAQSVVSTMAHHISQQVHTLGHAQREVVHAAAAISLNLPLFLLGRAQGLLHTHGIDPLILLPAFGAMAKKAAMVGASEALTGPARRGDRGTIQHHLRRLADDPELRAAYALLSNMILRAHGHADHGHTDL